MSDKDLVVTVNDGLCVVRFNRPRSKNAFNHNVYTGVPRVLKEAAADPSVRILAFTGTDDYFSSGNDMKAAMEKRSDMSASASPEDLPKMLSDRFHSFVSALIDFPKPMVAVVNGPAVGLAVTMLGLCDAVYATDTATFYTPFSSLGLVAEGCSTYTFPLIMGPARASQLLLFGKKISAVEAAQWGLVTEVVPAGALGQVWAKVQQYAQLPPRSMLASRTLIRNHHKPLLHQANDKETEALLGRFGDEESMNGLMNFMTRKSRL